jgi:hypothetical protein
VTIGDEMALQRSSNGSRVSKLHTQRAGQPTFDVIVEVKSKLHNQWRVTMDSGQAVDAILEGRKYPAEVRADLVIPCRFFSLVFFSWLGSLPVGVVGLLPRP